MKMNVESNEKKTLSNVISAIIILVCTLASFFTELKNVFVGFVNKSFKISNQVFAETIAFIIILLIFIAIYMIIVFIRKKYFILRQQTLHMAIDADSRGRRISDFQSLRENARNEVLVMGVGMSNVSTDTNNMIKLLNRNVNIKLLLVSPDIIIDDNGEVPKTIENIVLTNTAFSEYFNKTNHKAVVKKSIENFSTLISARKQLRQSNIQNGNHSPIGSVELRVYPYFVPMNVTISDMHTPHSELIAEFCIPFTNNRFRTKLKNGETKKIIEEQISTLWNKSILVDKDA